jgi:hypothetical protein
MRISKRFGTLVAIAAVIAAGAFAAPRPAQAYWLWRGGVRVWIPAPAVVYAPPPPVVYYAPRPVYGVPPVVYAPPPVVVVAPRRIWVPAHWRGGYWAPGYWR